MENNINDENIRAFFGKHKTEIADNGFAGRVNAALPRYTNRQWIVWLFAASGLALSIALSYNTGLLGRIFGLALEVPYYYWLAAIFALPLLVAGYYFSRNNFFTNFKI